MSVVLRFPGPQKFAPSLAVVARVTELINSLNVKWGIRYDFSAALRAPPRTLRPRKGPAPTQPAIAEVIRYFITTRDMFAMTPHALQTIGQELVTAAVVDVRDGGNVPTASTIMLRIANAQKRMVIARWEAGGGDLPLAPLSPDYVAYKLRLGYPAKIGTLTGQSLAAIRKVRVVAVRV